jgi:hypothetical protein
MSVAKKMEKMKKVGLEIHRKRYPDQYEGEKKVEEGKTVEPAPETPPATPPVEKAPETPPAVPPVSALGIPPVEVPADPAAALIALQEKHDKLEHKHSVLVGKEYAEVPRLQAVNKDLEERNSSLEQRVVALETKLGEKGEAGAPTDPAVNTKLGALISDYGDEAGTQMSAILKEQADAIRSEYDQRMVGLETQIANVAKATSETAVGSHETELTRLVPDWREIDVTPGFFQYLKQKNPFGKGSLLDALKLAHQERDTEQVAEFFIQYKTAIGQTAAPSAAKPSIEGLVAPTTTHKGGGELPSKDFMTSKELDTHTNKSHNPRYRASDLYKTTEARVKRAITSRAVV